MRGQCLHRAQDRLRSALHLMQLGTSDGNAGAIRSIPVRCIFNTVIIHGIQFIVKKLKHYFENQRTRKLAIPENFLFF